MFEGEPSLCVRLPSIYNCAAFCDGIGFLCVRPALYFQRHGELPAFDLLQLLRIHRAFVIADHLADRDRPEQTVVGDLYIFTAAVYRHGTADRIGRRPIVLSAFHLFDGKGLSSLQFLDTHRLSCTCRGKTPVLICFSFCLRILPVLHQYPAGVCQRLSV